MTKTEHFQLNQWELTDRIMMEDFNADNKKIDDLLHKTVQQIEEVRDTQLQFFKGEYTGTGVYGAANQNTLTFPFAPKLVVVRPYNSHYAPAYFYAGETVAWGGYVSNGGVEFHVTWSEDGKTLSWYNVQGHDQQYNYTDRPYHYFAIG